jgi:hypothetical protein
LKVKKTYVGDYSKDDEQADTIAPIHWDVIMNWIVNAGDEISVVKKG